MRRISTCSLAFAVCAMMASPAAQVAGQQQQVREQLEKKQSDEELKRQEDLLKAYDLTRKNYYTEAARRSWLKAYQQSMDKTQQQDLWRQTFDFYDVVDPTNESKYWIGVQCVPKERIKTNASASDGDRKAKVVLSLPGGLVVNSVTSNSPAESAGIEKGDVIISFGEQSTRKISDLSKAIDEAKGKEKVAVIVRDSGLLRITVKPAERPKKKSQTNELDGYRQKKQDYAELQREWSPQVDFGKQLAWEWAKVSAPKLPADVDLTLVCKGNDDPIMIIKRGDDQWTIRKGEIDELPDDIKVYAGHIYRSAKSPRSANLRWKYDPSVYDSNSPYTEFWQYGVDQSVGAKESIESLAKKVEQLQKTVEQLKKDR